MAFFAFCLASFLTSLSWAVFFCFFTDCFFFVLMESSLNFGVADFAFAADIVEVILKFVNLDTYNGGQISTVVFQLVEQHVAYSTRAYMIFVSCGIRIQSEVSSEPTSLRSFTYVTRSLFI